MVEVAPDGMVLTDALADGHPLVHANAAFEALTGYHRGQVLGRNLAFLLPADGSPDIRRDLANCLATQSPCTLLMRNIRADGSDFWNELTLVPLHDDAGRMNHHLGVLKDVSQLVALREQVRELEHELHLGSRELVKLATRDTLTTLYNRRYFLKRLEREWLRCQHERYPLVLFNLMVDGFKGLNQTLGTQVGDECLQRVAHILQTSFPLPTDVVARCGSVEFMASSDCMPRETALALADTIRMRVRELPLQEPGGHAVSASIGLVYGIPDPGITSEQIMHAAARTLADAKREGGNRVCHCVLKAGC
jgi:diguanylate cyclase (GGDEF)-like protein/PAS domain S-box-containing protein